MNIVDTRSPYRDLSKIDKRYKTSYFLLPPSYFMKASSIQPEGG